MPVARCYLKRQCRGSRPRIGFQKLLEIGKRFYLVGDETGQRLSWTFVAWPVCIFHESIRRLCGVKKLGQDSKCSIFLHIAQCPLPIPFSAVQLNHVPEEVLLLILF